MIDEVALADRAGRSTPAVSRSLRAAWAEVALAVVAFAVMCLVVLSVAPQAAEPDDGAYRASIVAMSQGHLLTLSATQVHTLARALNDNPSAPPTQWIELSGGRYISEKDPGYPFLAVLFQQLGLIRWAPLFFGALACLGLFAGARRWLGSFGGAAAVGLYCSSGAALAFAWRDYMPTFTDASLVAAGSGALLWTALADGESVRRRTWVGVAGFLALELATFVRYTDVVILGCAVVAMVVAWRARATRLQFGTLCAWLASVAAFCGGLALFDDIVYGGPLTTGYPPGEITFDLGAVGPNLRLVPAHLITAMPMLVLALLTLSWMAVRQLMLRRRGGRRDPAVLRDLSAAAAIAGSWFAIWALYSTYTWTTDPTNFAVQDVRFYLPAIGAVSLLGAWLVTRVHSRWRGAATAAAVTALFGLGIWSFHTMYAAFGVHLHG